jgi:hypothetical protein
MQVQLDEEIWEVNDRVQLGEVLAGVSDRAQAKGCLVTELTVGQRKMTDRELVSPTLSQPVSAFGSIVAVSMRVETVVQYSEDTGKNFGYQLRHQAQVLVDTFRNGHGNLRQLDEWFGQMADYLEWLHIHESMNSRKFQRAQDLSCWIKELLHARKHHDEIRMADMLEYEVIPRLPCPVL